MSMTTTNRRVGHGDWNRNLCGRTGHGARIAVVADRLLVLLEGQFGPFGAPGHGQSFLGLMRYSGGDSRRAVACCRVAAARIARVRSRSSSSRASFSATGRCARERRQARLLSMMRGRSKVMTHLVGMSARVSTIAQAGRASARFGPKPPPLEGQSPNCLAASRCTDAQNGRNKYGAPGIGP